MQKTDRERAERIVKDLWDCRTTGENGVTRILRLVERARKEERRRRDA